MSGPETNTRMIDIIRVRLPPQHIVPSSLLAPPTHPHRDSRPIYTRERLTLHHLPSKPLQMHRRQTQNLAPPSHPHSPDPRQLLAYHPTQPRSYRLSTLVNQHASVVIEFHNTPIRPLVFLRRAHDDGVPDIAASDFIGGGDGGGAVGGGLGAEGALFLDYDDYAVAWGRRC